MPGPCTVNVLPRTLECTCRAKFFHDKVLHNEERKENTEQISASLCYHSAISSIKGFPAKIEI